jgi:IQ domain-containing protein G
MSGDNNILSYLEAERVVAIVEDATEKLGFLDSITPDVLQHRDELSKFIGDEISKAMREQKAYEKDYERLIEERAAMKGMVNKSKYKAVQEAIQDVSRTLRESTNCLVRSLKENPNVSGNLRKVEMDRTELHDSLLRCNQELRDRGTFHTIMHKVDEERNSRLRFEELKVREKILRDTVTKLEEQLTNEQRSFQRTVTETKQAIAQLKEELQTLKGSTAIDAKFKRKESLAYVSARWREYKLEESLVEAKVRDLQEKIKTEEIVHADTKEFLVKKHLRLQDEITTWENTYTTEIDQIDAATTKLLADREVLQGELFLLRERREKEKTENRIRKEKEDLEKEMKKQSIQKKKREDRARRQIHSAIKSWIKRKEEMEAISGGAGKKGKKDKGKKGKKK